MTKQFLEPIELLKIATDHAYCAEHLLTKNAEVPIDEYLSVDALFSIASLMHMAFELTLKAFLLHEHRPINQYRALDELIQVNNQFGFSKQEVHLINTLSRQQAFRKGIDYALWENRQQLHVFCEQIMELYSKLQELMPLELQQDYQKDYI